MTNFRFNSKFVRIVIFHLIKISLEIVSNCLTKKKRALVLLFSASTNSPTHDLAIYLLLLTRALLLSTKNFISISRQSFYFAIASLGTRPIKAAQYKWKFSDNIPFSQS